jgi:hypothetical protein
MERIESCRQKVILLREPVPVEVPPGCRSSSSVILPSAPRVSAETPPLTPGVSDVNECRRGQATTGRSGAKQEVKFAVVVPSAVNAPF